MIRMLEMYHQREYSPPRCTLKKKKHLSKIPKRVVIDLILVHINHIVGPPGKRNPSKYFIHGKFKSDPTGKIFTVFKSLTLYDNTKMYVNLNRVVVLSLCGVTKNRIPNFDKITFHQLEKLEVSRPWGRKRVPTKEELFDYNEIFKNKEIGTFKHIKLYSYAIFPEFEKWKECFKKTLKTIYCKGGGGRFKLEGYVNIKKVTGSGFSILNGPKDMAIDLKVIRSVSYSRDRNVDVENMMIKFKVESLLFDFGELPLSMSASMKNLKVLKLIYTKVTDELFRMGSFDRLEYLHVKGVFLDGKGWNPMKNLKTFRLEKNTNFGDEVFRTNFFQNLVVLRLERHRSRDSQNKNVLTGIGWAQMKNLEELVIFDMRLFSDNFFLEQKLPKLQYIGFWGDPSDHLKGSFAKKFFPKRKGLIITMGFQKKRCFLKQFYKVAKKNSVVVKNLNGNYVYIEN